MKKLLAVLLAAALVLSFAAAAAAEEETSVYAVLTQLLEGKKVTLTLNAEDVEVEENRIPTFGGVVCEMWPEEDRIVLTVKSGDSDMGVNAALTSEGVRIETTLLEEPLDWKWEALLPTVSVSTADNGVQTLKIGMTGPDRELMNMTVKVKGSDLASCQVNVQAGFITGPGAVHSMWDSIGSQDGSTSRDFSFTYDEDDLTLEGSGEETLEQGADGITLTRRESFTVYMNEEEIGSFVLNSCMNIQ